MQNQFFPCGYINISGIHRFAKSVKSQKTGNLPNLKKVNTAKMIKAKITELKTGNRNDKRAKICESENKVTYINIRSETS